jgi:hypothetical protein
MMIIFYILRRKVPSTSTHVSCREIERCLQNRPLAFVGDSRMRAVYHLLLHQLAVEEDERNNKAVRTNSSFQKIPVSLTPCSLLYS